MSEPSGDAIDQLLDRFESEWRSGRRPSVEEYWKGYSGTDGTRLLRELVCLDVIYRRKSGEPADAAEYAIRFPAYTVLLETDRAWIDEAVERSAPAVLPGRIGPCRVIDRLAVGGQAVTYRAYHEGLKKSVVVKHARGPAASGMSTEGPALAALNHSNLVRVYDAGIHDDRPFLVLEDIAGRSLEEYAAVERPGPRAAAAIIAGAARGLGEAHRHGIYHLDVSPGNILITADGKPRVIDFGLSRQAERSFAEAAIGGTLAYMSPEQAEGKSRLDARTDVFGLGAVLYRLLSGKPPYEGGDESVLWGKARDRHLDEAALPGAGVPARLQAICLKALARDPAGRYPSGDALADDLEAFLQSWPWWRTFLMWAIILAVTTGIGWSIGRFNRLRSPEVTGELKMLVYRDTKEGLRPLTGSLPIRTGDRVQVQVKVPAETHASLFLIHGRGEIRRLADFSPETATRTVTYPGVGKVVPLTGPAGTGFFFVVGNRKEPVSEKLVRESWGATELPTLPAESLIRINSDQVYLEAGSFERPRDVGAAEDVTDPTAQVRERLDEFRGKLRNVAAFCDGIAFWQP